MKKQVSKNLKQKKKLKKRNIISGIVHIHASVNNTIVTITDEKGNTIAWSSAGSVGYKGSRKSTPFAAGVASETAAKTAMQAGLKSVKVYINGTGPGKDTAIRSLQVVGLEITELDNVTPIPHNGCQAPRMPR